MTENTKHTLHPMHQSQDKYRVDQGTCFESILEYMKEDGYEASFPWSHAPRSCIVGRVLPLQLCCGVLPRLEDHLAELLHIQANLACVPNFQVLPYDDVHGTDFQVFHMMYRGGEWLHLRRRQL